MRCGVFLLGPASGEVDGPRPFAMRGPDAAERVRRVHIEISLLVHQSTGRENQKEQHKAG